MIDYWMVRHKGKGDTKKTVAERKKRLERIKKHTGLNTAQVFRALLDGKIID